MNKFQWNFNNFHSRKCFLNAIYTTSEICLDFNELDKLSELNIIGIVQWLLWYDKFAALHVSSIQFYCNIYGMTTRAYNFFKN